MRVHPLSLEGQDRAFARRIADDAQPVELANRLARLGQQRVLVRLDRRAVE